MEVGRKTWHLLAHRNLARDGWTRSWEGEEQAVRLTFVQVDVVLPLLLVPCAVVSGALQDVSPVSDVMPNGHLLQSTVRVPHGPPSLPDLGRGRAEHPPLPTPKPRPPQPRTDKTTQDPALKTEGRVSMAALQALPSLTEGKLSNSPRLGPSASPTSPGRPWGRHHPCWSRR